MSDKTMSAGVVVAALRCCGNRDTKRIDCEHCPLQGPMCVKRMLDGAADLIEAQQIELARVTAERDGRCVVLPCKIGDTAAYFGLEY